MRIISFFIRTLFILGIIVAAVYFLGGQLWMAISLRGFVTGLRDLENSRISLSTYTKKCQTAPGSSSLSSPVAIQLRFLDSTHYQTELRCTLIGDSPVVLSTGTLPMLVSKVPGTSGLYIDLVSPTRSTVTFRSLAATKSLSTDTTTVYASTQETQDTSPATSCTGWGYQCCAADQELGSGKSQTEGVTDCPGSCFSVCMPRPYVQSFVSDPYPSHDSTIVMTSDQLTVTFSYQATVPGNKVAKVHIDYGDGSSEDSTEISSAFVHTYTCASACQNQAVLTVVDAAGNSSVVNDSSKLYIKRE